ncbi:MAG: protein kinase [Lentisphaeraceae bacterium]|nr:protein kinase [Lentisphaeraceae bacterium]
MEKAVYCENCDAANLIENCNEDFIGSCYHCGTPMNIPADDIGKNTIVAGRYQIRELLEEDRLSNIYFALDLSTNDLVILRIFCWDYSYSIKDPEDFLHMAESISLLAQPGHVEIQDWGIDDDLMFTVWTGDSIETIERLLQTHSTFEPDIAVSIIKEAAQCLSYTFDEIGVGHYALSPGNIYLDSKGSVKLSELGFAAQLFKDENFLDAGIEFYDWRYQAPEIILDWYPPDIRCDMFSLGYVLYTMITGEKPFDRMRPVSQVEYERFSFSRADQYRFGETFMDLFHGLTATNPSERFHSWKDAINFMDYYLQEEKLLKSSALSGRRRSMTTSFNLDLYKEIEKPPPRKAQTQRKRRVSMSASDIRQKSSFYVSEQPRKMQGKTIRPFAGRKHKDNSLAIVIGVVAALFAVLLIILAAKSQEVDNAVASTNTYSSANNVKKAPEKKKTPAKPQKDPVESQFDANVQNPPRKVQTEDTVTEINEVPNPGKKKTTDEADEFNELTFMVREYTIRKEWENAIKLIDKYNGPFKDRQKALKDEIIRKRLNYLESRVVVKKSNEPTAPVKPAEPEVPEDMAENATLEALAQKVYSGNIEAALNLIPIVESVQKMDLHLLKGMLEGATDEGLNNLMAENYSKDIGKDVELKVEGIVTKGQILQVSTADYSIKMNVVFLTRQLERIYKFTQLDPLENVKRLVKNDPSESALLQFIYLIKNRQLKPAQHTLLKYNGVLKKELLGTMEQFKNEEAEFAWNELLSQLNIDPKTTDNNFLTLLNKVNISPDDSWVFFYNLNDFNTRFSTTQFYQSKKHLISLMVKAFEKQIALMKKPDAIVSADGKPGTVTLESALREVGDGGTIRLLPGVYAGSSSINTKIRIIGARGVYLGDTVAITTDRVELKNVIIDKGFIDIYRNVRDIKITNCEIYKGGIIMRGDNTSVNIENTVMHGLKVGKNRLTQIKDCVILENPDNANNYTISGFISGPIINSIIRSKNEYAISMAEKLESTLSLRYCMIFGLKGICYINKDRESIQGENDFNRKAGRAVQLKIAQPTFVDEDNFDFRLKDFSPGFFEGENKKCIGVQYNYAK